MYVFIGAVVLVSPWLSVVYSDTDHAHRLTQLRERTMRRLRTTLSEGLRRCRGCAILSSAKGSPRDLPTWQRGFCVFLGVTYARTYVYVFVFVHAFTYARASRTMAIQRRSTTF